MRQLIGSLFAGSVLLIGGVVAPAADTAASPPMSVTLTAAWSALQQDALQATATYRGDGTLRVTGAASPVVNSSVTTSSGPVSVVQRTLVAADDSGTVVLQLVFLGGSQELVTEASPAAGYQGATLVLAPGTSSVTASYPHPGAASLAATTAWHRRVGRSVGDDAVVRPLHGTGRRRPARLAVAGSCYPAPATPIVVTTEFGRLIQGDGQIVCGAVETLGLIVSIYRGLVTKVGTTGGGTKQATYYSYSTYAVCNAISGTHDFRTSQIWSVNGTDEGGATSTEAALHCT